jgi:hypothetical protein
MAFNLKIREFLLSWPAEYSKCLDERIAGAGMGQLTALAITVFEERHG